MTAPSKLQPHNLQPSSSKPPKTPTTTTTTPQPPNPNPSSSSSTPSASTPFGVSEQDQYLSRATYLTRQELLRRRSHNLKQLASVYRDHYWALMEEFKVQYRDYYWKYGISPFKDDQPAALQRSEIGRGGERDGGGYTDMEVIGENNGNGNGNGNNKGDLELKNNNRYCLFIGCKLKAMALTSFCHLHILSDPKQKLYKPCSYVVKSAQAGPITCARPILRAATPSLCSSHFQKAQKHVTRALRKAGLNVSSSSKLAPKFHVIIAEYVRQIQAKRRAAAARKGIKIKNLDKEASGD